MAARFVLLALLAFSGVPLLAEDWVTTDGRHFVDVQVIKVEADSVTILDHDGGALVPLASLPADLQKRFSYDPAKAAAAAAARAKLEASNQKELDKEKAFVKARNEQEAAVDKKALAAAVAARAAQPASSVITLNPVSSGDDKRPHDSYPQGETAHSRLGSDSATNEGDGARPNYNNPEEGAVKSPRLP